MADYTRTAQALVHTIDDDEPATTAAPPRRSQSSSPMFTRRSVSSGRRSGQYQTLQERFLNESGKLSRKAQQQFYRFTPLQRVLLILAGVTALVLGILFLVFNERIFGALAPVAKKWRDLRGGWSILWAATFLVSFPPLIGYSSCVTLAGFVYGVPKGWLIAASATVVGSTASFLVSRTILRGYVTRLTQKDKRFAALALTLKHDGLKLLVMIRLCPLPYSLSNGAVSMIPTVEWYQFLLASTIASPKLLLHVFVGSQLGKIAERGDKMDAKTKAISYLSIAIGVVAGAATGWYMYTKTKARAKELEAEERNAAIRAGGGGDGDEDDEFAEEGRYQYSDDAAEREAAEALERGDDEFSLHSTARGGEYTDDFSIADEDAEEFRDEDDDPFTKGDGDEEQGFRGGRTKK